MLADVSDKSLSASAQRNFSQLVRDFSALTSSFAEAQPQTATWELPMYDVERDLVRLIGGGGPRLTDDRDTIPGLPAQVADAQTRTTLEAFRTDVELFYDAATTRGPGGVTPPRSAAAALF